jgi:hypothetical protein
LRDSLVRALPSVDMALASEYTPSRASDMLVSVARVVVAELSKQDVELKRSLEEMATIVSAEVSIPSLRKITSNTTANRHEHCWLYRYRSYALQTDLFRLPSHQDE